MLADALDRATGSVLENGRSPQRKAGELDNRGSHFYLALYWAQELAAQTDDAGLAEKIAPLAEALAAAESKIVEELNSVQGSPVEIGGYYHPDESLVVPRCGRVRNSTPCWRALRSVDFLAMATQIRIHGDSCKMTLTVTGWEFPELVSGDDAQWVCGSVDLVAAQSGSFTAQHDVHVRVDELAQFRNELNVLQNELNGEAELTHLEDQFGAKIELASGVGEMSVWVAEHIGAELRVEQIRTDQTYVATALADLNAALSEFPVRADDEVEGRPHVLLVPGTPKAPRSGLPARWRGRSDRCESARLEVRRRCVRHPDGHLSHPDASSIFAPN